MLPVVKSKPFHDIIQNEFIWKPSMNNMNSFDNDLFLITRNLHTLICVSEAWSENSHAKVDVIGHCTKRKKLTYPRHWLHERSAWWIRISTYRTYKTKQTEKQSRPSYKALSVVLKAFPVDFSLCVVTYLREYLKRTKLKDQKLKKI